MAEPREPFDLYADSFTVTVTPFGANLSFHIREAHPAPAHPAQSQHLGTIRMSVEHLKVMAMMIQRQVRQVEEQWDVHADVSRDILNQMHVSPEDWKSFWGHAGF